MNNKLITIQAYTLLIALGILAITIMYFAYGGLLPAGSSL